MRESRLLLLCCIFLLGVSCSQGEETESPVENAATVPPAATEASHLEPAPADVTEAEVQEPAADMEMAPELRLSSLEDVNTFLNGLPDEDAAADHDAMVAYLTAQPEFAAAGVSEDGTVWGEFSDGRLLVIFNNREFGSLDDVAGADSPPKRSVNSKMLGSSTLFKAPMTGTPNLSPPATDLLAQSSAGDLPQSDKAYVLSAMGTAFADATPDVEKWFSDSGYNVDNAAPTVEMLKTVSGAGVFYLGSHGGMLNDFHGNPVHAIWTATPIDSFNETLLRLDIEAGRVVYAAAKHDLNPGYHPDIDSAKGRALYATHYAITADFVTEYMSFAANSFVFVDACSSSVKVLSDVFLAKGASVYAGWDTPVGDGFANTATRFLMDRLLGTNDEPELEYPKQRPFDYLAVKDNMSAENLLVEKDGTTLTFTKGGGAFGLLMPSIAFMEVHEESDELFIYGMFGSEPGKVTIAENERPVGNWTADMVAVKLPDSGEGSAGDVVVQVRDHKSNAAPLTEWRGQVRYQTNADNMAPNLWTKVTIEAHFRADVHPYRLKPGEEPVEREVTFVLAGDSTAKWTMDGSSTTEGTTFEISGSGQIPLMEEQPNHELAHFSLSGKLEPQDMLAGQPPVIKDLDLHLHLASDSEGTLRMIIPGVGTQESGYPINQTDVLSNQDMSLDELLNIKADRRETATIAGFEGIGQGILDWDELAANHAPKLRDLPLAATPRARRAGL